jgi:signal transduction histidine kinase
MVTEGTLSDRAFRSIGEGRLSATVPVVGLAALIGLWSLFGWLTLTERQAALHDVQDHLGDIASAYSEHSTTLMQMGMPIKIKGMPWGQSGPGSVAAGEKILLRFRNALNLRGVSVWIYKSGTGPQLGQRAFEPSFPGEPEFANLDGMVSAKVQRPKAGIVVIASMPVDRALVAWRRAALFETALIGFISVACVAAGLILFNLLRHREMAHRELILAKIDLGVALESVLSANKSKAAFLAAMSHELRTPLNAIIGYSEIMATETFGPLGSARYKTYSRDIHNSGNQLLHLINDVLDLARLESHRAELIETSIDLPELVRDVGMTVENRAGPDGVVLTFDVAADLPLLRADYRRVKQAVLTLLSNAIKFTPAGGQVFLSARSSGGTIEIAVADTGIGFDQADLPKAFEMFEQIDSRLSRRYEGCGLGLPLARHIAELHGATLTIESELGRGCVAKVRFPASRSLFEPREMVA